MKNSYYKKTIKSGTIGYAYCKIICDKYGQPYDFKLLEVSDYFEEMIGIKAADIFGKKASVLPNFAVSQANFIELCYEVAFTRLEKEIEYYFEGVKRTYNIKIFSPRKKYFIMLINESKKVKDLIFDEDDRYETIVNSMNDVIWIMDMKTRFSYLSPSAHKVLGYPHNELINMSLKDSLTPSSFEYAMKILKEELLTEKNLEPTERVRTVELQHKKKDGSIIIMEHSLQFLRDKKSKTNIIFGLGRDITEWMEAKENTKKSNERLQLILDSTAEGIYGVDRNGNCSFCNASCLRLLGYDHQDELLGKSIDMLFYPANTDNILNYKHKKIIDFNNVEKGSSVENDIFWRKDGTFFNVEYFTHPQYYENEIIGVVVTFYDLTSKIVVEGELRESERSKSVLLANLPGMAYRCNYDRNWTMHFVSDGCYDLTGYKPDSLVNNCDLSFNDIIKPEYREYIWNSWQKSIDLKKHFREEYVIVTASGSEKWVLEQGQVIYDSNNEVIALEGLIIDITDQKLKQKEIEYLSYHDGLTGLHNRIFFDRERKRLDNENYLPLSVIIGDINGLKLLNDALGHQEGDQLIKKTALVFQGCCDRDCILARTGGDEFSILLPNTDNEKAYQILKNIQDACNTYNNTLTNETYRINVALGFATKINVNEEYTKIQKLAEDYMYKRKLLERSSSHSAIIASIKTTMYEKSQETEEHAERIQILSKMVGTKINLSQVELDELALLATLHDIGKVGIEDKILKKPGKLTDEEWVEMKKHPEVGYRIAMASSELMSIADYILCHHEKWDGTGYPQGLKGTDIPLLSRIIAIVDAYDAMTQDRLYRTAITKQEALTEIRENSGTQFDPQAAEIFIELMLNEDI